MVYAIMVYQSSQHPALDPSYIFTKNKKKLHFLHRVKIRSTFKKVNFTENVKNWYWGSNFNLLK